MNDYSNGADIYRYVDGKIEQFVNSVVEDMEGSPIMAVKNVDGRILVYRERYGRWFANRLTWHMGQTWDDVTPRPVVIRGTFTRAWDRIQDAIREAKFRVKTAASILVYGWQE